MQEEIVESTSHRQRLRNYLRELFEEHGTALPEEWPHVPHEVFNFHYKELRERIDRLYDYIDRHPTLKRKQKQYARFFPESVIQLLLFDWHTPEEDSVAQESTIKVLQERPAPSVTFDQLYCTPDTTERRADRIRKAFSGRKGKILFLGDDDLGSVTLAQDFEGEIHMLDLDQRLLQYVNEQAPSVITHSYDLIGSGVPVEFYESFDAVVLDPPWDIWGAWAFLSKAIYCLKRDRHARIYFSFCPLQLELEGKRMAKLIRRFAKHGMGFESILARFNIYDLQPIDTPAYGALTEDYILHIDSPLMDALQKAPYAYAHLYELRRLREIQMPKWKQAFFKWWNTQ